MDAPALLVACPHCHARNRLAPERRAERPACGRCKLMLFNGIPVALGESSWAAHAERSDLPLVVDFWAAWCAPCRQMAPAFAAAAQALEPGVRLAKVDTEAEPALAARFGIRSLPTLVMLARGREIARQAGAMPTATIVHWVRQHLP